MELIINEDLKKLIEPLQANEYNLLEKSILKEGCRDSIIVWGNVIVDGHNRYEICNKHNISFETKKMEFEGIGQAKQWMINNQLARRNLTDSQRRYYIGKRYEEEKKEQGGTGANQFNKEQIEQSVPTAERIAKETNTSHMTVKRNEEYSKAIDEIKKDNIKIAEKILTEEIKTSNKEVIEFAKEEPEKQKKIIELIQVGKVTTIKDAQKEIKKQERKEKLEEEFKVSTKKELKINGTLIHGDFFNEIENIENQSIDLLFSDPPYAILQEEWDKVEIINFTEKWLEKAISKVKSTGRIYISFSHIYMFELYKILEKHNYFGFNMGQVLIWEYRNNNKHSNRKLYRYSYEPIFYLYGKDAEPLNFTPDTYGEVQNTVWTIATPQSNFKEGKHHPAQKPLELLERIIKTGSKQGDLVLDPFAGSGTTGVICEKYKRNYILIEKDDKYVEIIRGRLNELERETF